MMKRTINKTLLREYLDKMGPDARKKLAEKAQLPTSTINQLVAPKSYPHSPRKLTRYALCKVTGIAEDELFPFVRTREGRELDASNLSF